MNEESRAFFPPPPPSGGAEMAMLEEREHVFVRWKGEWRSICVG